MSITSSPATGSTPRYSTAGPHARSPRTASCGSSASPAIPAPSHQATRWTCSPPPRASPAGIEHHEFWPCTISVLDNKLIDRSRVHGPKQVTDAYLLALATAHHGRFVTFEQSVALSTVRTAKKDNLTVLR